MWQCTSGIYDHGKLHVCISLFLEVNEFAYCKHASSANIGPLEYMSSIQYATLNSGYNIIIGCNYNVYT